MILPRIIWCKCKYAFAFAALSDVALLPAALLDIYAAALYWKPAPSKSLAVALHHCVVSDAFSKNTCTVHEGITCHACCNGLSTLNSVAVSRSPVFLSNNYKLVSCHYFALDHPMLCLRSTYSHEQASFTSFGKVPSGQIQIISLDRLISPSVAALHRALLVVTGAYHQKLHYMVSARFCCSTVYVVPALCYMLRWTVLHRTPNYTRHQAHNILSQVIVYPTVSRCAIWLCVGCIALCDDS